jgi:hypothetical protein
MLFADEKFLQLVEAELPELPVMLEPRVGLAERLGVERAVMFATDDLALNQSSTLKDHQMFRNGVERNREGSSDLRNGSRLVRDRFQNRPPDRIGHSTKSPAEMIGGGAAGRRIQE